MRKSVLLLAALIASVGCMKSPESKPILKPTEEIFVALPYGLPIDCGNSVREAIFETIESFPPGTHLTFFLSDNQALLGTTKVPAGGKAHQKKVAKKQLEKALERLDPEMSGGSLDVDLIAISSSVRKYRKTDLKPRLIIIGSPLIVEREQGMSITNEVIPCDGSVHDRTTSYGKMETFPKGTTARFLTPRQDYGRGPNHRSQIEHFLRYLLNAKGSQLLCLSSDTNVVFNTAESQWDDEVEATDECNGLKKVSEDEPQTKVFDRNGKSESGNAKPDQRDQVRQPDPQNLPGDLNRVLFLVDISGSVAWGPDGDDRTKVFDAIKADVYQKLDAMEFTHFAICGFGGWKDLNPRLTKFPDSVISGLHWSEATRSSRDQAIQFVKQLQAGGGTPTLAALHQASILERPFSCIIYTDGVPTLGDGGQTAVLKYAKELREQEIVINPVGVGALSVLNDDFDFSGKEFLTRLAEAGGGEYFVLLED